MPNARVIATDGKFRIVRVEDGNRVDHMLEKHDGFDALGVERWKDVGNSLGTESVGRQLRDWIIKHSVTCSHMKEMDSGQS